MIPPFPKAFEEDGFVAVSEFCYPVELSAIESALARFIDLRVPRLPAQEVFYEDKAKPETLKQIQRMHEHDDFFGAFIQEKPKALAQELLGEPVIGKNLQFFNKPPGISQATPAHQDGHYFMLHPCMIETNAVAASPAAAPSRIVFCEPSSSSVSTIEVRKSSMRKSSRAWKISET